MKEFEVVVIGAGVIGCGVARALTKKGITSVAVLEKEPAPARHTSGRNSGVLHSGINPKPGGLKARFCVEGNRRLKEFCRQKSLPLLECGTVVVASREEGAAVLDELLSRAQKNDVPGVTIVDEQGLKKLEPNAVGVAALHAPSGAIASGSMVTQALAAEAQERGVSFFFRQTVTGLSPKGRQITVRTQADRFQCDMLINCAGLYADRIAHAMGTGLGFEIVPFRGEYYRIRPEKSGLVRSMVYPAPDLRYPFLGVHWTKTIDGGLKIGPNAILAFGREAYSRWSVSLPDTMEMMFSASFWKMVLDPDFRRVARSQAAVSFSRARFVNEARKLVPSAAPEDFVPGTSGIRAQLVRKDGNMVDDILIEKKDNALHVLNAVSPGFTCVLPFAEYIVEELLK